MAASWRAWRRPATPPTAPWCAGCLQPYPALYSDYSSHLHLHSCLEVAQIEIPEVARVEVLNALRLVMTVAGLKRPLHRPCGRPSNPPPALFQPINNVFVARGYYMQVAAMQQLASQRFMWTRTAGSLSPTHKNGRTNKPPSLEDGNLQLNATTTASTTSTTTP